MQHPAFERPGRFFRGNLHTHSTTSDGALPAGEVCRRYAEAGYDFLCMSDHFMEPYGYPVTDTRDFRTNRFTTIPGAELHTGAMENGEIWHILAVGLPGDFAPPEDDGRANGHGAGDGTNGAASAVAIARRAVEAGAFVALAHPEWNGLSAEDARLIDAAHAVEIYNHGCHVDSDRGHGIALLDMLLSEGRRLSACATDDAHFRNRDYFGGWVMVKAEANEPEALVAALKAGEYYASTGPELRELAIDGDSIIVECSPAERVIAMGARSVSRVVHGPGITRATLPLEPFRRGGWVRVGIHDGVGRRAWSNPLWFA